MLEQARLEARYLDCKAMWKRRAIAAIEPIKGDAVLLTDPEGRLDG
jgi:hypothetical protein